MTAPSGPSRLCATFLMIPLTTCLRPMAENAGYPPAPLLEGALLNDYSCRWIAFPAIKGYLRMYPGDFCRIFPRGAVHRRH